MTNSLADIVVKATPGEWRTQRCGNLCPDRWNVIADLETPEGEVRRVRTIDQVLDYCGAEEAAANAELLARSKSLATLVLEAREKGRALLAHRVGDLPTQGWLRDNDASRAALADLAATLAKLEAL